MVLRRLGSKIFKFGITQVAVAKSPVRSWSAIILPKFSALRLSTDVGRHPRSKNAHSAFNKLNEPTQDRFYYSFGTADSRNNIVSRFRIRKPYANPVESRKVQFPPYWKLSDIIDGNFEDTLLSWRNKIKMYDRKTIRPELKECKQAFEMFKNQRASRDSDKQVEIPESDRQNEEKTLLCSDGLEQGGSEGESVEEARITEGEHQTDESSIEDEFEDEECEGQDEVEELKEDTPLSEANNPDATSTWNLSDEVPFFSVDYDVLKAAKPSELNLEFDKNSLDPFVPSPKNSLDPFVPSPKIDLSSLLNSKIDIPEEDTQSESQFVSSQSPGKKIQGRTYTTQTVHLKIKGKSYVAPAMGFSNGWLPFSAIPIQHHWTRHHKLPMLGSIHQRVYTTVRNRPIGPSIEEETTDSETTCPIDARGDDDFEQQSQTTLSQNSD